ncbi:sporulation histidine kinase inhibitor Sda [Effusibacillus dendaii]|uniref:Sporulation histidine kinase inhibitor Sda n=1 Tax=Effusibacillus dendaii TaxID=2743772 RepID=A0A7I8DGQ2_9BACL|nr:sporulation histidine kinase inhibitor Sda [Effusibacillus dendaii]BCJ88056.1 hypothetical protein skT53_30410 [Effusibacillus dendaii]
MRILTDENLIEAYKTAVELKLDPHFIELLMQEIKRRKLDFNINCNSA